MKKYLILLSILLVIMLIVGCAPTELGDAGEAAEEGPIKIGFLGPLSGDAVQIGEFALQAVIMAVEKINENGGVNGRMLELIVEDGKCAGKESVMAANKLVYQDKVSMIIGGFCSTETLAIAPIVEEGKIPIVSPCSSAPKITDSGDYIFRIYPSDSYQGVFLADYIFNELGYRTAGVLYINVDWGVGVKDAFKKRFLELGGDILVEESFEQDATDMRSQIAKVKSADPDFMYMPAHPQTGGLILTQAKEMGLNIPAFGADGSDALDLIDIAGDAAEGFQLSIVAAVPSKEVKLEYNQKYGHGFVVCGIQAYDTPFLVSEVLAEAGSDPTAIKDALYNADFEGEIGRIQFDENGDLVGAEYNIKEVIDGVFVVQE